MIVAKYQSGAELAAKYSQTRFNGQCRNPQPDSSATEFALPDYEPLDSAPKDSSSGQISYRCDSDAGPRVAFAYVKTANFGSLWAVPAIASYLASSDQVSTAREIVRHCVESLRVSPEWTQHKARLDAEGRAYQRARQQGRAIELQQQEQAFMAKMQGYERPGKFV